jgi:LuxR family quorum-sensing transcriptional regulator LasR
MDDTLSIGEKFATTGLTGFAPIMCAGSSTEAMSHIEQAVQDLGFERLLFALTSTATTGSKDLYLHSTYPQEWRDHYEKHNLRADDPTVRHCFKSLSPFVWVPESFQTKEQQDVYEQASSFGLHTGVTLPIRGLNGEVGMLTCVRDEASGKAFLEDLKHKLGQLSLLRDVAFDAIIAHIEPVPESEVPVLTARELECLQWIAAGKTTWEIGRILSISEAGVNFHICNLRTKFGVSRRNDVVIRAIRLGLIQLP